MPRRANSKKRQITQYGHDESRRLNNPPVGMVTNATDQIEPGQAGKKTYQYDPHIDPSLQFDTQGSDIQEILNSGLGADSLEDAKAALAELATRRSEYLNWTGKAERTSFDVPTVSLHVHERIDPRTIIESVTKRNGDGAASGEQLPLFERPDQNPPLREAVEFYKHSRGWS